jgi:hypothetical protein
MTDKDKKGQFKKGASGNPAGRPLGSRNQAMLECQQLLQAAAPNLTKVLIEQAQKGNVQAMRLCMERIYPASKEQPIQVALPAIESAKDLPLAYRALNSALADGKISAAEGQSVIQILTSYAKIFETVEHEQRLTELELNQIETRKAGNEVTQFAARLQPHNTGESPQ